ncbi:hypothetical protein PYCCODRAFT_352176 [Trametes coccinea BRFM310]|uniref:C2H2-type domain-containing protein n=1 Tax=Trametes coccinea (strain BRFM310) TaxID=1353009 RepID=A0A1Y2J322_TRAC3|nr:hypothetical protein PYCCODRAFT_352176 [Trametes coccinea BRFM310]
MSASTAPCQARSPLQVVLANHPPSTPHTPPRPRTSHGSENLPLQLPTSPWDEDSEEARAIHQFGIEDYDEDGEKEVFDSIPGYDDVCVGDVPDMPRSAGSPSKVTTNPTPCGTDVLGWTHTTDDVDTDSVGSDQAVDRSQADESCSSSEPDSDSDSYTTTETDSSDDSQPEMFSGSDTVEEHPAHSSASIFEEHVATEAGEDAEVDRFDEAEYCGTADKSACSEAEQSSAETDSDDEDIDALQDHGIGRYSASPCVRPLRRSARLQAAPKRQREGTGEEPESSSRPAKRRNLRKDASPVLDHEYRGQGRQKLTIKINVTRGLPPRPRRSQGQAASQPPTSQQGSARSGRIPQAFLKNCIISDKPTVACAIEDCGKTLVVKEPQDARRHIKTHYKPEVLKDSGRKTKCLWNGCGEFIKVGGHADGLMRHYNEAHLGLRYGCPGKCTDKYGKRRAWSRTDELTRHERRDPCEYLLRTPLPRGKP